MNGISYAMIGFSTPELVLLLLIVLVIFGAGKLPQVGKSLGTAINEFKNSVKEKDEVVVKKDTDEVK